MPLRPGRVGRVGVVGHPVAKTAVVAKAVTSDHAPVAKTAVVAAAVVLYKKFVSHVAIPGWTSTLISIFFLGAVQLICLGILGEYLGRIYEEVKRRPHYVVRQVLGCPPDAGAATAPTPEPK